FSRPVISISFSAPHPRFQVCGALSLQYINELISLFSFALSPKAAANVQPFFYPPSFFEKKLFFFFPGTSETVTLMNVALRTPFPPTP
ncbi:hypothetical protein, partial [Arenibacter sp. S6351L]|uniref:hypothetical protein n=1 Tax=Arenibacter sp. S6351L TaxID=2926407 RepID=UPI001FF34FCF